MKTVEFDFDIWANKIFSGVCTRDGQPIFHLKRMPGLGLEQPIFGTLHGEILCWNLNGRFYQDNREYRLDLMLQLKEELKTPPSVDSRIKKLEGLMEVIQEYLDDLELEDE